MYKYGINLLLWTSNFTEKDLPLLSKAKQLGCDVVEIPLFNPDTFPSDKVKRELVNNDLEACVCYGCEADSDVASLNETTRKKGIIRFKTAIDHARIMGVKKIAGVVYKAGGIFTGTAPKEEEWAASVSSMKEIAQYAQEFDISICIEQINRYETYFINTTDDAIQYCMDVNEPNMRVLLDTHHLILEELSMREAIIKAGPYLEHFHASENNRGIPGTGQVKWEEVYGALKQINYAGWMVIESFYLGFGNIWKPVVSSPEELVTLGLRNLKRFDRE